MKEILWWRKLYRHKNVQKTNKFKIVKMVGRTSSNRRCFQTAWAQVILYLFFLIFNSRQLSIFRCLLQWKIWFNSHKLNIEDFDIFQFEWQTHEEGIRPVLFTKAPVPEELRDMLNISCKDKNCNSKKCQCFRENFKMYICLQVQRVP